jgi:WD40 repeat protein
MLGIVKRDSWELTYSNSFAHKKAISCVEWLTEQYFATAGADKVIKVWDFELNKLLFFVTSSCPVLQVSYCQAVSTNHHHTPI